MDEPKAQTTSEDQTDPDLGYELPPGQHPLEIAARRGIGPMSPLGRKVWHGDAFPCVSCGQLVRRTDVQCNQCGQDLSEAMIEKMRAHAGPWYVLEHLRPFPGVALERIIRQIRRGLLTETSIVRGPSTDYQWRFAVETPGLCRYFGRCWSCHHEVTPADTYCQACLSHLSFEKPRLETAGSESQALSRAESSRPETRPETLAVPSPARTEPLASKLRVSVPARSQAENAPPPHVPSTGAPKPGGELAQLADAVHGVEIPKHADTWDAPPRLGPFRATWVVIAILAFVITLLLWITGVRRHEKPSTADVTPGMIIAVDPGQG